MSLTIVHSGPAFQLSVAVTPTRLGHHLQFFTFVPIANHPERRLRFDTVLSTTELRALHHAIGQVLEAGDAVAVAP